MDTQTPDIGSATNRPWRWSPDWAWPAVLVLALLAARVPFLPATLEDIDSVNFDLGVHDFNPVLHHPHPPGYPVYIFLAKLAHPFFRSHAAALGFVSALFGSLAAIPLYWLLRRLGLARAPAFLVSTATLCSPLVWFNSVRPMSDLTGFFAVTSAQCLLLGAGATDADPATGSGRGSSRLRWAVAALVAGLSLGVRLQAVILVGPACLWAFLRHRTARGTIAMWFVAGVAAWLVPLVYFSGGPFALYASFGLLVRDALPAEPLVARWGFSQVMDASRNVLFAPWGPPWLGRAAVALSAIGVLALASTRSNRRTLWLALLLFGPYLVFHYFVQWTETIRYAIPIVPLAALTAAFPFIHWRVRIGLPIPVVTVAVGVLAAVATGPALAAYHRTPSPPAQAIARIAEDASTSPAAVSGHFSFTRYLDWLPPGLRVLRPAPRKEWRTLTDYWKHGERQPVLFLKDPTRTTLLLVSPNAQKTIGHWTWPDAVRPLMKGERPGAVALVRLTPPRWFCESGFLVTLEAGRVAQVVREPHRFYVRASGRPRTLLVTGEVKSPRDAEVALVADGREQHRWSLRGAFTIRDVLPPSDQTGRYMPMIFECSEPVAFTDLSLEADDAVVVRPAHGFYPPERDERQELFRWMAPTASAEIYLPEDEGWLTLRGKLPYDRYQSTKIAIAVDGTPVQTFTVNSETFEIRCRVSLPSGARWGTVTLTSSNSFVPADVERNGDERILAIRVYGLSADASTGG